MPRALRTAQQEGKIFARYARECLASLLFQRAEYPRAQFYIRRINNSELANAESLWLGIKVERRMNNLDGIEQLATQLRKRFGQSREALLLDRGSFDD